MVNYCIILNKTNKVGVVLHMGKQLNIPIGMMLDWRLFCSLVHLLILFGYKYLISFKKQILKTALQLIINVVSTI